MVKVGFIALPTTSCHVEQIPVLRSKRGIWSSPKSGCPNLSRPLRKGGRIRPSQYSNHAKGADQKLWCAWNQDNHRKRPTRTSIKALKQIDRIENELRIQCSDENARNSKIIATTWPIRMAPMPHTTNISVRPPAPAPIRRAYLEQQGREETGQRKGCREACRQPHASQRRRLPQHHRQHIAPLRAQRHADSHLARARGHRARDHAVNPHRGQSQRQSTEERQQRQGESAPAAPR